jgi:hypothetical protein
MLVGSLASRARVDCWMAPSCDPQCCMPQGPQSVGISIVLCLCFLVNKKAKLCIRNWKLPGIGDCLTILISMYLAGGGMSEAVLRGSPQHWTLDQQSCYLTIGVLRHFNIWQGPLWRTMTIAAPHAAKTEQRPCGTEGPRRRQDAPAMWHRSREVNATTLGSHATVGRVGGEAPLVVSPTASHHPR